MKKINRREFLGYSSMFLLGACAAPGRAGRFLASTGRKRVLVIGAGMAGLSAASRLAKDFDVMIVEGRDRIGGRIYTTRSPGGAPLELGANWIHGGEKNPVHGLARHYGLRLIPTQNDFSNIYVGGRAMPTPDYKKAFAMFERVKEDLYRRRSRGERFESFAEAFKAALRKPEFAEQERLVRHFTRVNIEDNYAADAEEISFSLWDKDIGFEGSDFVISSGYTSLLEKLGQGLDIRLNTEIQSVSLTGAGAEARDTRGQIYAADFVVVTVPLGVLKKGKIKFDPPLPAPKRDAISRIGFGVYDKTAVTFQGAGLEKLPHWLELPGGKLPLWFNFRSAFPEQILVALSSGAQAREAEAMRDDALFEAVEKSMREVHKGFDARRVKVLARTRWAEDPFAYGSYSYPHVSEAAGSREELFRPVGGRIYFAGEACQADHLGSVHAAYISGQRAASLVGRF